MTARLVRSFWCQPCKALQPAEWAAHLAAWLCSECGETTVCDECGDVWADDHACPEAAL